MLASLQNRPSGAGSGLSVVARRGSAGGITSILPCRRRLVHPSIYSKTASSSWSMAPRAASGDELGLDLPDRRVSPQVTRPSRLVDRDHEYKRERFDTSPCALAPQQAALRTGCSRP